MIPDMAKQHNIFKGGLTWIKVLEGKESGFDIS
jgi:hypothetical protein